MKYCEEYAALLDLYVDAELTAEEARRVEAHLAECPACRAYADDALAMRTAFADLEDVPVPEGFADSVCAAIRAQAAPRKAKKAVRWSRVLAPLAACCAIVILLRFGPVSGKDSSAPMMKSANYSSAAESAVMADMAVPAETEYQTEEYKLETATDSVADTEKPKLSDAGAAVPESEPVYEEAAEDAEPAGNSSMTTAEEKKEIVTEAETSQDAETEASRDPEAVPSVNASVRYAMELWLPAECADLLAEAVPFRETDTHIHYEMTRDECLLLQARMAEKGFDGVIGMSAEPTTELALVVLSK